MRYPVSRYDNGVPGRISEFFAWNEVTYSDTAIKYGLPNPLSLAKARNAVRFHDSVLHPARSDLGVAFHVGSWSRSLALNRKVGGAKQSDHIDALAADVRTSHHTPYELVEEFILSMVRFHQLINEYGRWTHVSAPPFRERPRMEILTAHILIDKNGVERTYYKPGNHHVDPFTRMLL